MSEQITKGIEATVIEKLIWLLKSDDNMVKFLKHHINIRKGLVTSAPLNTDPKTILVLESLGLFELVNHKHILKKEIETELLEAALQRASIERQQDQIKKQQQQQQIKLALPWERPEWVEYWKAEILPQDGALEYFPKLVNPKIAELEYVKTIIFLSLVSEGDQYGDRGRKCLYFTTFHFHHLRFCG